MAPPRSLQDIYQRGECAPCPPHRDPKCPCVSIDRVSLEEMAQALYLGPPQFTQPVPRLGPPRGARFWQRYAIFVVAPNTATADASATSGASDLATSETAARGTTVSVLTPATTSSPVSLYSEVIGDNTAVRVTHFGARVHSSMRMIRLALLLDGMPVIEDGSSPNVGLMELSDFADLDTPADLYVDVQPRKSLEITARNLDTKSGYLVEVMLRGYSYATEFTGPLVSQAIGEKTNW